jgi:signal transduction histidine kinase
MIKKTNILLSFLFLTLIPISWWILLPYAENIPHDFSYKADVFSVDNLYNEKENHFQGSVFSDSKFSYESKDLKDGTLLIKNSFDVKKLNGDKIFAVERLYGINPKTGGHTKGKGDKNRNGYLFAPKNTHKRNYIYWHINYNAPAEMVFQNTEIIAGLLVYHYLCYYKADQTENLHFLPGVPDSRGVELDIKLETWVDPVTGLLIKYEDYTTAWYYDIKTKKRLHPWNKFHNEYQKNSIITNVEKAQFQHMTLKLFRFYLPAFSLFFAGFIVLVSYLKSRRRNRQLRPVWIFYFILVPGWLISLLIYSQLSKSHEQKHLLTQEKEALEVMNSIKNELELNQQVLENLRYYHKSTNNFSSEKFSEMARHWIQTSNSIQALQWVPKVDSEKRNEYEHYWQTTGFRNFQFREMKGDGKTTVAAKRPLYFPVYFIEPYIGNEEAFGLDIFSIPARKEIIRRAIHSRDFFYTGPFKSVQNKKNQKNFLLFNPVYDGSNSFLGFFLGVYQAEKLINTAINRPNLFPEMQLEIIDKTDSKTEKLFSNIKNDTQSISSIKIKKSLPVMNRVWELTFYSPGPPMATSNIIVLVFGLALTLLLATLRYKTLTDQSKKLIAINRKLKKKQYELQDKTKQLENKNKELEQFAYISSHDLQEPLHTVMNVVNLLDEEYKGRLDENADMYLNFITQATNRMSDLIKGLLKYSRIGYDRELAIIDCSTIMKNIQSDLSSIITETNTIIEISELPLLKGYQTELGLLFQNLITNAIKFRKKNTHPKITITAQKEEGHWKFSFTDNGIGIDFEHQEKIFVIFQRLHPRSEYEGTGIGLAHCQKIVDLHGGTIWVNSKLNEGSTFHFTIPN